MTVRQVEQLVNKLNEHSAPAGTTKFVSYIKASTTALENKFGTKCI